MSRTHRRWQRQHGNGHRIRTKAFPFTLAMFCSALVVAMLAATPASAQTTSFWKTHASCAPGNHAPALDQALFTLGGIFIGTVDLSSGTTADVSPDCATAVDILTKTTIDGSTKMANDPLFSVAAEFLAAELTRASGGPSCVRGAEAAAEAGSLLAGYAWDGITRSSLSSSDAVLASQLTKTLTEYNQGKLCQ